MLEVKNDIGVINAKLTELFEGASLIKFSYSGIYTLEFDHPGERYGRNGFYIDIGTDISISEINSDKLFTERFAIEDLFLIWSKGVKSIHIENDLSLVISFEETYICRIASKLYDPENIVDMRWTVYQSKDRDSLFIWVSDEKNIYCQIPE
jgi:hypothetical protein